MSEEEEEETVKTVRGGQRKHLLGRPVKLKLTPSEVVGWSGTMRRAAAAQRGGFLVGQSFQVGSAPCFGHHGLDNDCAHRHMQAVE